MASELSIILALNLTPHASLHLKENLLPYMQN